MAGQVYEPEAYMPHGTVDSYNTNLEPVRNLLFSDDYEEHMREPCLFFTNAVLRALKYRVRLRIENGILEAYEVESHPRPNRGSRIPHEAIGTFRSRRRRGRGRGRVSRTGGGGSEHGGDIDFVDILCNREPLVHDAGATETHDSPNRHGEGCSISTSPARSRMASPSPTRRDVAGSPLGADRHRESNSIPNGDGASQHNASPKVYRRRKRRKQTDGAGSSHMDLDREPIVRGAGPTETHDSPNRHGEGGNIPTRSQMANPFPSHRDVTSPSMDMGGPSGENPQSPNARFSLSGLLNTLHQKEEQLGALVSQILINNQDTSICRQLLETLIYFNVLRKIPTHSDALPTAKLEENIVGTLKGEFGAKQEQIDSINFQKEIADIVPTTSCVAMDDTAIVVTLSDTPNGRTLAQIESLRHEIKELKEEQARIQIEIRH